ncbi:MAG: serine hydrolase [Synechococcaceae cyanobacterium RL_1_2]|nr:serine hydrolase [Synechococcaceae cyanobacterium RL_1_2]
MSRIIHRVFAIDLDNNNYFNLAGSETFSAASTIKIPILVAFLQDIDQGKIRLDQMLPLTPDVVGGGSGTLQWEEIGKEYSALEVATLMITISDNTATNMIIKLLGGGDVLNARFQEWGLTTTILNNLLPDLEGTNTTNPEDLARLLAIINDGQILDIKSRDRFLTIMRGTKTNTLLPQGLEKDALIAHKTGDIGSVLGDAGIVDMPNGKRYVVAVMVRRPHNHPQAKPLIQEISHAVYQYFKSQSAPASPDVTLMEPMVVVKT